MAYSVSTPAQWGLHAEQPFNERWLVYWPTVVAVLANTFSLSYSNCNRRILFFSGTQCSLWYVRSYLSGNVILWALSSVGIRMKSIKTFAPCAVRHVFRSVTIVKRAFVPWVKPGRNLNCRPSPMTCPFFYHYYRLDETLYSPGARNMCRGVPVSWNPRSCSYQPSFCTNVQRRSLLPLSNPYPHMLWRKRLILSRTMPPLVAISDVDPVSPPTRSMVFFGLLGSANTWFLLSNGRFWFGQILYLCRNW